MSGIYVKATQARAILRCDAFQCDARWESELYAPRRWGDEVKAASSAFALGWRVFNGARSHRTYCPEHEPKTGMLPLYGPCKELDTSPEPVRNGADSLHDLDRMGICSRCGQGITARELLDGDEQYTTNTESEDE